MIADLIESDVKLEDDAQKSYSPGIIYCQNSEDSDKIAEQLFSTGVPCKSYHLMKNDRYSNFEGVERWSISYFNNT